MLLELGEIYNKATLEKGLLPFVRKFYSIDFFKPAHPALLIILQKLMDKKPITKPEMALLCFSIFEDKAIYKRFVASLPATHQKLIEKLLWVEKMDETAIEYFIGESVTMPSKFSYNHNNELKNEYSLFSVNVQYLNTYPQTTYYTLYLHPLLKLVLAEYYPKPPHYYFIPLNDIPETSYRFTAENLILQELPRLLSYYMQDGIKYSVKGRPAEATLNKLQRNCAITEFPSSQHDVLGKTRSMLLAGMLYNFNPRNISIDTVSIIKALVNNEYQKLFTSSFILTQIKGWGYMDNNDYNKIAEQHLTEIIKQLPPDKWVSAENLADFISCRLIDITPIKSWALNNRLYYEMAYSVHNDYNEKRYIGSSGANLFINYPFIKGSIFLLAAFGLMEIAYADINTTKHGSTFYSGYDGLMYLKLTALGRYVFGFSKEYEPAQAQQKNKLHFDEDSLMILAEGDISMLDLMLANYAEKAGNNRYKITHTHFLKDCRNKNDIEKKISLFKKTISSTLPAFWEQQFIAWRLNATKVEKNLSAVVFKIPAEARDLQKLMAQDAVLKTLVLKAEQFNILVPSADLSKFKARMKELGYLVE